MKKGNHWKYGFVTLIIISSLLLSYIVFGQIVTKQIANIMNSGPRLMDVDDSYSGVAGVSHTAGEVKSSIYSDYLRVSGSGGSTRLVGVNTLQQATYVVPLIMGVVGEDNSNCDKLCSYTLAGKCIAVVYQKPIDTGGWGTWAPVNSANVRIFDAELSNDNRRLELNEDYSDPCDTNADTILGRGYSWPMCICRGGPASTATSASGVLPSLLHYASSITLDDSTTDEQANQIVGDIQSRS